ncbi:hypothetical protein [Bradyrhizobium neotropicale]|nr:hypothetical protein [Bradyrhizobium neotropicale]
MIERLETHPDNVIGDGKAVAALKDMMHAVATVKERHNRKPCRPKRR